MQINQFLQDLRSSGKKSFAVLIDPDHVPLSEVPELMLSLSEAGPGLILVGGSLLTHDRMGRLIPELRKYEIAPVVIFPGNALQVVPGADGILFLSLISGRNPEMLIGNQVVAAPMIRRAGLEVVPTGYMLIDSGRPTSAHYMSGTFPIPGDKPEIAACTAMAGEMLGLKAIYLEGGSGAERSISTEMIQAVRQSVEIPLIVGGGIRTQAEAERIYKAGADLIVLGNALEDGKNEYLLNEISALAQTLSQNVPG
ncbi:MAG: geranylgeranylglyceryl/heptaprenylglyceryl phosphate synthase [Bacteroidia bacterium]|nr:geranylgeranylglyceryl/heptaprenylglyceryl phosphate synthase [Bacteroidia bacterium]